MEGFLYTGAVFGIALGASILPFRKRDAAEKWLTGVLLIIGAVAAASITRQHQLSSLDRGGLLEILEIGTGFAVGPLLYGFCVRRSGRERRGGLTRLVHFVPALVVSAWIAVEGRFALPIALLVLHQMAYTAASIRVSFTGEGADSLARQLCGAVVAVHLAQLVRMAFSDVHSLRNVVPVTIIGGFCTIAFLSLRRSLDSSLGGSVRRGSRRSSIDDEIGSALEQRLVAVMQTERPWLEPDLSLDRLAATIGATPHQLSELLNVRMGTSFNEYVGSHRLAEARRRLADPENDRFTIESIAEASGFSSRSSFYAAFRREFGSTPTRYRKESRASSH